MRLFIALSALLVILVAILFYQIGYQNGQLSMPDQEMLSLMAGGK